MLGANINHISWRKYGLPFAINDRTRIPVIGPGTVLKTSEKIFGMIGSDVNSFLKDEFIQEIHRRIQKIERLADTAVEGGNSSAATAFDTKSNYLGVSNCHPTRLDLFFIQLVEIFVTILCPFDRIYVLRRCDADRFNPSISNFIQRPHFQTPIGPPFSGSSARPGMELHACNT